MRMARLDNAHLESNLEQFFATTVKRAGGLPVKIAPIMAGIPDRLVILPGGRMFLIELKADGGRLSPIQRELHARIAKLGVTVIVLTGRTEVLDWIEDHT